MISVCITGSPFQGLLLQARVVGGTRPVGTFRENVPKNTKLMKCTSESDTVTHLDEMVQDDPTCFVWKAPNEDKGQLRFV